MWAGCLLHCHYSRLSFENPLQSTTACIASLHFGLVLSLSTYFLHTPRLSVPMSSTAKVLDRLVRNLYSPLEPSNLFIESLTKYLTPQPTHAPQIDSFLNEKSEKAFLLYKKLPNNEGITKLVYVFLCLSNKKPSVYEDLRVHLRQGALGFETSYFNPVSLPSIRSKVNNAVFSIVHAVYSHGLIYRQLKIEQEQPHSLSHRYFLGKIQPSLRDYEKSVLESFCDFLDFYSNMYIPFKNIRKLGILNDSFRNKMHLKAFTALDLNFDNVALASINPLFEGFEDVLYQVFNECTISYLLNGSFEDPFSEYFIRNHVLDYGLIPPFISRHTAETIAYIGKYTAFLKSVHLLNIPREVQSTIGKIDLSKNSAVNYLKDALVCINTLLYKGFFENFKILDLLEFIHSTFLFGRIDFIEKLFTSLKESRKTGRKNICNLLENALNSIFPKSPFNSLVDIYITQEEFIKSDDARSGAGA
ncbi:uncharacterized protein VICG_01283 [Vittaforma corneae ATCC 50505]|uniref:Spindle pole body component n=1 Tax=Vittaforma corneae (strain ATCC 50505) TaxID=993615 RepID=L2GME3_VITCO|nr:uncharacterized protein VICG_01283 [Vittaforma corneae ATCC 50505]ELA41650.1 hypothetical protein VICG_01283 [Vittaforma corneae ATCC 50505]